MSSGSVVRCSREASWFQYDQTRLQLLQLFLLQPDHLHEQASYLDLVAQLIHNRRLRKVDDHRRPRIASCKRNSPIRQSVSDPWSRRIRTCRPVNRASIGSRTVSVAVAVSVLVG